MDDAVRNLGDESVLASTVRGLLAPRRAVPIALVVVPLTIIQDAYSRDPYAVPLALSMCGSFLLIGPALWRALFSVERPDRLPPIVRGALYAIVGAVVVLGIGRFVPQLFGIGRTFLTTEPSLAVCLALFWVGGWGLARDIDLEERLRRESARAEALARDAEHAQLLALKSHLDPHFLFNTLNAIAEWCREDGAVAEKAIVQLSSMLRTMMGGIHTSSWPLSRDVELVDALFALHSVRDPNAFFVERNVPEPLPDIDVPPMILLPLAENAMKHGPLAKRRGKVGFSIVCDAESVTITLSNPGAYGGPRAGGSGIPIVERRLARAYGDSVKLTLATGEGERCVAMLVLPRRLTGQRDEIAAPAR